MSMSFEAIHTPKGAKEGLDRQASERCRQRPPVDPLDKDDKLFKPPSSQYLCALTVTAPDCKASLSMRQNNKKWHRGLPLKNEGWMAEKLKRFIAIIKKRRTPIGIIVLLA